MIAEVAIAVASALVAKKLLNSILMKYKFLLTSIVVTVLGFAHYRHQQNLNLANFAFSPTPSSSPTIQYQTYKNDRYGYSFVYPNNVAVSDNVGEFGYYDADSQSKLIVLQNINSSGGNIAIGIETDNLPPGKNLLSYVKKINYYKDGILTSSGMPYDIMPNRKIISLEDYKQEGKPAVKLVSQIMPEQGSVEDIYFQAYIEYQPGKLLIISDPMAQYHPLELDEQILTSFHFYSANPEPDWVKYTFPELGFKFSLPSGWEITPSNLISFPEFSLRHDQLVINGRFDTDGSFRQKSYLEDWKTRPDSRASYMLFSDYSRENNYEVLASIKTPQLFIIEAFIPLYNGHNLILSIDNPALELTFYRFLNTLSRLE